MVEYNIRKYCQVLIESCLSIDLEVGKKDKRIHQFGAVRGDNGKSLCFQKGKLIEALGGLDEFSTDASFLLGHNIIQFDIPFIIASKSDLKILDLPVIDTLRLNPLAFPRNPYHHLVKHYHDGALKRGQLNDPEIDARLALDVFKDQLNALRVCHQEKPELVLAWHWLCSVEHSTGKNSVEERAAHGFDAVFSEVRGASRPTQGEFEKSIFTLIGNDGCIQYAQSMVDDSSNHGWPLAYSLAWLSVAGGCSVMPPWVRHQFPQAATFIKLLRDTACNDSSCSWCVKHHNPTHELKHWFGFDSFRPNPVGEDGRPLQLSIVESAMRGRHVLGILPTGTGKSLCYQIPALSRYEKTGALTVVISPLVALMADQVAGLEARGITSCAAINGMLSMPERSDVLDRIRLGDISIIVISPEQLRNKSVRKVLSQREIGAWILDEAHCLSKWGHDFRPDYRYVGRFIKERAGKEEIPAVLCLTATAKPDVVVDVMEYFKGKVGIDLELYDGGSKRDNLDFFVIPTSTAEKFSDVYQILNTYMPTDIPGGAIVYCSTRKQTEEMSEFLQIKEIPTAYFHSALQPESKKDVQKRFINGELRVMAATNAFGMGIDKPDVRLVIHADIPGSLENYLQEAGRAGRDRENATCVLLYTEDDVERQFGMSARSRLTQREIQSILKSLRQLDRKKRLNGAVVATTGEILDEDDDKSFMRDPATDDTRARTAISWLEEAQLLTREENQVQIFPSSLRVNSLEEAEKKLHKKVGLFAEYKKQLLAIVEALLDADADEGISTDELKEQSGLSAEKLRAALYDLESIGIASNDTALTAFVHVGVENSSQKRLEEAISLEQGLIGILRELGHDLEVGESSHLHLRQVNQQLKDEGYSSALPERVLRVIRSLSMDGREEESGKGSLSVKRFDSETHKITLLRDWEPLDKTAQLRRTAADRLLQHLLGTLPAKARGTDLLAETTLGKLLASIEQDMLLKADVKFPEKLLDRALMWLHEMEIIRLNKGLAIFRPAMTVHLSNERRNFVKADFSPLKIHYQEQVLQIHIMAEYVHLGLQAISEALQLTMDYFSLEQETFLNRWLPNRDKELSRQTSPESWRKIVEVLNNPWQKRIVADDREQSNVLVLAGPGSGKTRVLVHRIAYLVRAKRENPRSIIALAYNRHAALEIRKRLNALIGRDAKGVSIMTCHALAMRLIGASFSKRPLSENSFTQVLLEAIALLQGSGLPPDEANDQRERLLSGFRWILVDEYQDIGPEQYDLISALAGRNQQEEDSRLSLMAVGDDDQNIYAFDGASVEFIRRFEKDYAAKPAFLLENYRSTQYIIDASNLMIAPAHSRMKLEHIISIDRARKNNPPGGEWQAIDPVVKGKVQILQIGKAVEEQAISVMEEFSRMSSLVPDWDWAKCAVIAKEWKLLEPVRAWCEIQGIPVQMADEDSVPRWRLRETQMLVNWIRSSKSKLLDPETIRQWLDESPASPWWASLRDAMDNYLLELSATEIPVDHFFEWLAEWARDMRRKQTGLMLLTSHRAKGLEFDHVAILDGSWERTQATEDKDASRRLYYVAMTRARQTLMLAQRGDVNPLLNSLVETLSVIRRAGVLGAVPANELQKRFLRLSLKDIDLGYAGRKMPAHPIHQAIDEMQVGVTLHLKLEGRFWLLINDNGHEVGKLSANFTPPAQKRFVTGKVLAVIVWKREDSEPQYHDKLHCEIWEVIVPELVFA